MNSTTLGSTSWAQSSPIGFELMTSACGPPHPSFGHVLVSGFVVCKRAISLGLGGFGGRSPKPHPSRYLFFKKEEKVKFLPPKMEDIFSKKLLRIFFKSRAGLTFSRGKFFLQLFSSSTLSDYPREHNFPG